MHSKWVFIASTNEYFLISKKIREKAAFIANYIMTLPKASLRQSLINLKIDTYLIKINQNNV